MFNPTGGISSPVYTIAGIDLATGNALAVGSIPLTPGSTFQLDYQATVSGLIDTGGLTVLPPGLTSSYQLTAVGSFTEVVTSLNPGRDAGDVRGWRPPSRPNSFFELYYNPAVVANNLAGTGFNVGTLILAGTPSLTAASAGVYSLSTIGGHSRHHAAGPVSVRSLPRRHHRRRLGLSIALGRRDLLRSRIFQDTP